MQSKNIEKKIDAKEEIYLILAEFYKNPNEDFYLQFNNGSIDKRLKELFTIADYGFPSTPSFKNRFIDYVSFKQSYTCCFSGVTKPYALPIESVYKVWTTDPESEMLNSKGYIFGDSALHIKYLFNYFQLEIPNEYSSMPDHLTLLLEFLAFLIKNRTSTEVKQFITDHFDWLEDFKKELSVIDNSSFFINVTELVIYVTQNELTSISTNSI